MDDASNEARSHGVNDDIDYMHPNGKPEHQQTAAVEDDKPSPRAMRIALQEADGHYMPKEDPYIEH